MVTLVKEKREILHEDGCIDKEIIIRCPYCGKELVAKVEYNHSGRCEYAPQRKVYVLNECEHFRIAEWSKYAAFESEYASLFEEERERAVEELSDDEIVVLIIPRQ